MKTKPIDYTGCHPAIKEQLERNNAIYCKCWYDSMHKNANSFSEEWIVNYLIGEPSVYISDMVDTFMYAEPIETKRVLKDPVSLMQAMVEHEWEYSPFHRCFIKQNGGDGPDDYFADWHSCGDELKGSTLPDYFYEEIEL